MENSTTMVPPKDRHAGEAAWKAAGDRWVGRLNDNKTLRS
jgi:hypothetical protein